MTIDSHLAENPLITRVVGARPNFPKAAPMIRALAERGARQRLVHTGQHCDDTLSESFFDTLDLCHRDVNLGVGSGNQAQQTTAFRPELETRVSAITPRLLVVYGDISSTLPATLADAIAKPFGEEKKKSKRKSHPCGTARPGNGSPVSSRNGCDQHEATRPVSTRRSTPDRRVPNP